MHERARIPAPKPVAVTQNLPASSASVTPVRPRMMQAQLLHRQKTAGNQAVQKLIRASLDQQQADNRSQTLHTQSGMEHGEPRATAATQARPVMRATPKGARASNEPRIDRAWYNFDIPFTNYQFDPSIEGIKTAAGVVKDAAVSGFEWIVDEIKGAVSAGVDWLSDKWNAIQELASSAFDALKKAFTGIIGFVKNPLGFLTDALMRFDGQAISKAWATFSGMVSQAANGFKALTDGLLSKVNVVWGTINGFATSLLGHVTSLTGNFLFKKLPDALQKIAFGVIDRLKSLWKKINDGWTALFNRLKAWIDGAIDSIFSFVRRVMAFGINVVIAGVVEFGKIVMFLMDLFSNPQKYVALLAERSVKAFDGVESRFSGLASQYFSATKTATPVSRAAPTRVQRAPAPSAETRTSASWSEIGHGIGGMMGKKWDAFKSNPMAVVTSLLMDMIFPIVGNIKDIVQLFKDIKKVVTAPLGAGSLEELWTSLLQILDIPIMISHTVVSILMRTLMVPLIVATFIPHPVVKGIAAAVGYGLLGAFVQAELLNLGQKLLLLRTGETIGAQKEEAYNRISDSLIALAMAAVITLVMLILQFIANVMKGVYSFIKGKVFGIEPVPVESKGATPAEAKPADTVTDNPDKLVICRVCDTVSGIPKDLMAERASLTPEARARLDQTASSIFKDPANPTATEFANLRSFMEAMEKRGGGDLEKGLQDLIAKDAKKNAPPAPPPAKPPFGPRAADLPTLRTELDAQIADIDTFAKANPDKASINESANRLRSVGDGPLKRMETGIDEANDYLVERVQGSIKGAKGELESAQNAPKGTQFGENLGGREIDEIHVDGTLKQVKRIDPFTTADQQFVKVKAQLQGTLEVAEQFPVNGKPRPVVMEFQNGVNSDVAKQLRAVEVNGRRATILGVEVD